MLLHSDLDVRPARGLAAFVDQLQASGRYTFRSSEGLSALGVSDVAFHHSLRRLAAKGRVVSPRRGFHVIVPLEYRSAGAPPPSWYLGDLMDHVGCAYYVGLLSAAAMYGAAHHQPQEFQVITARQLRPISVGRSRIRFFAKRDAETTSIEIVNTPAGTVRVSTPEATALDLGRYASGAGYLDNVATVLAELAEMIAPERLADAARDAADLAVAQRVGYLLDLSGEPERTDPLAAWVAACSPRPTPLRADLASVGAPKNARWRVLINDTVEADT